MALNVSKWSSHGKLAQSLTAEATEIPLGFGEGLRFRLPDTDYCYATIRSNGKYEHVKIMAVKGDTLHVVRGQDNTVAQTWSPNSCIEVEWNPAQICEYTKQCALGETPTTVAAGTYCLSCSTCITIGEDGRITAVDGEKKCK